MQLVDGVGASAEASYQESLEELRKHPEASTALLLDAYYLMDERRYYDRWKVVNTLGAMEHEEALDALSLIAGEFMPEHYAAIDTPEIVDNAAGEEALIRAAAVRGVAYLARNGVDEAKERLLDLVAADDPYVRKVAVLGIPGFGRKSRAGNRENQGNTTA